MITSLEATPARASFSPMAKHFYILHLPVAVALVVGIFFYFNFTAEDAYITYRYAENLVNTGSLVYNAGEPINAMTSPLHAVLSAAFFLVTGQTVLSNKLFALLLLLLSALLVWFRYIGRPHWQLLALILVLLPPSIVLWTFGGLETPLLLFLATATVVLADRAAFSLGWLCLLFLLAGLGFITRYDSVLFFVPVLLYAAAKVRSGQHMAVALVCGAVLPLLWLAISFGYYGDLLPTSFYVKTPSGSYGNLINNGIYIASYLLYVGVIPVLGLAVALLRPKHKAFDLVFRHFKSLWWLYLGLALQLAYGLTMATHHMMFSFRFFVPYLPSAAILTVDLVARVAEARQVNWSSRRTVVLFTGFASLLVFFQLYQIAYTYTRSVNGLAVRGEYPSLGARDYMTFMQILRQEAYDIEGHWVSLAGHADRRPRIITYAAGMLPYTFRDSYIYEQLVSYRHCFQRHNQGLHADYLHILAPRQGSVDQQLPKPESGYTLVSSYAMVFDGSQQTFLVFYDPAPEANNLSATINEPCQQSAVGGSLTGRPLAPGQ
jgi:arabinofuranosyltransferase